VAWVFAAAAAVGMLDVESVHFAEVDHRPAATGEYRMSSRRRDNARGDRREISEAMRRWGMRCPDGLCSRPSFTHGVASRSSVPSSSGGSCGAGEGGPLSSWVSGPDGAESRGALRGRACRAVPRDSDPGRRN
jgi:hypothetical protein